MQRSALHAGAGRDCPAVSLYLTVTSEFEITAHESRVEIVPVVANLRHHDVEPLFNAQTVVERWTRRSAFPQRAEDALGSGQRLRRAARQAVGDAGQQRLQLRHRGRSRGCGNCRVEIRARRGSLLDKLVAELMIVAK